jgi:hypothetical protein
VLDSESAHSSTRRQYPSSRSPALQTIVGVVCPTLAFGRGPQRAASNFSKADMARVGCNGLLGFIS